MATGNFRSLVYADCLCVSPVKSPGRVVCEKNLVKKGMDALYLG